jgi:hypothetical protein
MCRPKDFFIFFSQANGIAEFPFLVISSELRVQCVIGSHLQHGFCTLLVHILKNIKINNYIYIYIYIS